MLSIIRNDDKVLCYTLDKQELKHIREEAIVYGMNFTVARNGSLVNYFINGFPIALTSFIGRLSSDRLSSISNVKHWQCCEVDPVTDIHIIFAYFSDDRPGASFDKEIIDLRRRAIENYINLLPLSKRKLSLKNMKDHTNFYETHLSKLESSVLAFCGYLLDGSLTWDEAIREPILRTLNIETDEDLLESMDLVEANNLLSEDIYRCFQDYKYKVVNSMSTYNVILEKEKDFLQYNYSASGSLDNIKSFANLIGLDRFVASSLYKKNGTYVALIQTLEEIETNEYVNLEELNDLSYYAFAEHNFDKVYIAAEALDILVRFDL